MQEITLGFDLNFLIWQELDKNTEYLKVLLIIKVLTQSDAK